MKRLPMRKIREALRLRADGFSGRQVAQSLSLGRATISDYFRRAEIVSLGWPLPNDLSDGDLERLLFPRSAGDVQGSYPQPDWALVHRELRRKGVTLALLWEAYRAVHPDGYGDSRFCELYTRWEGRLSPVMRQAPPCRGAAIRGLCRDDDRCRLPRDRRGQVHPVVRRGAWRLQLHLCRGDLVAEVVRLDILARPGVHLLRWRAGAGGLGQSQGWRHQGLLLRRCCTDRVSSVNTGFCHDHGYA